MADYYITEATTPACLECGELFTTGDLVIEWDEERAKFWHANCITDNFLESNE